LVVLAGLNVARRTIRVVVEHDFPLGEPGA
jgi:hypothetical protein